MPLVLSASGLCGNMEAVSFVAFHVTCGFVKMTNLSIKRHASNWTVKPSTVYRVIELVSTLASGARSAFVMNMSRALPILPREARYGSPISLSFSNPDHSDLLKAKHEKFWFNEKIGVVQNF